MTRIGITGGGLGLGRGMGPRLTGGGWVEGVSGLSFATTSTNAAWTPNTVTKSGGTLTWQVLSSTGALLLESVANKPTFDLSSYAGTKTLRVTSPDGWSGLTALIFAGATADITGLNLTVATALQTLNLQYLSLVWVVSPSLPMPSSIVTLTLSNLTGLTWTVGPTAPFPTVLQSTELYELSGLTPAWDGINAIRSIVYQSSLSQALVDAVLSGIHANKANYTYATPALNVGGTNAAPSGIYQAADPPTTGKEKAYDLVNGNATPAGPEWTVTFTA